MALDKTYIMLHIVTMTCHDIILLIYINALPVVAPGEKIVANCNDLRPPGLTVDHQEPPLFGCNSEEYRQLRDDDQVTIDEKYSLNSFLTAFGKRRTLARQLMEG